MESYRHGENKNAKNWKRNVVPFEKQDAARKYILIYLDKFLLRTLRATVFAENKQKYPLELNLSSIQGDFSLSAIGSFRSLQAHFLLRYP